jgi:hypothetical protein
MADTSTTPTTQTTITSNIPEWAKQYATDLLGFGAALTYPKFNPATGRLETGFQPYQGELVAGFSPLQQQAMGDLSRMQVSPQTSQATGLTGLAALQAQDVARYSPLRQQQYYRSPFERPGGLEPYMSPYMQNVVEEQKRQAVQDFSRQIPGMRATSARAGALGGTRQALMESEARRNLGEQLANIQATGLQNAYQQASQQALQEASTRAQFGLSGQQLREQSRQFGAGLGLQGLQQQLAAAGQLGQLGQQQYQQATGILGAQLGAGAQQQALKQQMLASDYQRFIDEMQYPYKQLEFFSNLLRGTPSTDKTTSIYEPSSTLGMIGGILGSGGGIGTLFGGRG